jgi:hypothetical protein
MGKQSASSTVACPRSFACRKSPLCAIDKRVDNRAKHLGESARLYERCEYSDHEARDQKYERILGGRLTGVSVEDETESIQGTSLVGPAHHRRVPYLNRGLSYCLWRASH